MPKTEDADLGLGMSQFVTNHVQSDAPETPATPETPAAEPKEDASPEPKEDKPEPKTEEKVDPKGDEKKSDTSRDDTGKFKKSEGKEKESLPKPDAKEKPKSEAAPKEKPKTTVDFESDDNPYRKRFKDTEKWAQQEHQRALSVDKLAAELKAELAKVHKKLDGTWSEEDEKASAVPQTSPAVAEFQAEVKGRAKASHQAAIDKFGKEKVEESLTRFKEVFRDDPFVQQRVMASEMPVFEAINAVRQYDFFTKYGNDPDAIEEKISAALREKMREEIRAEETARVMESLKQKDDLPTGLTKARGAPAPSKEKSAPAPKPLGSILPNHF